MSLSTSSPLATAQKSGRTVGFVVDTYSTGNSTFVYDSTAASTNSYTARIDPDGSFTILNGGSIGSSKFLVASGNFTWTVGATVVATLFSTGNMTIAGTLTQSSSLALKHNVVDLDPDVALKAVLDTRLIRFDWKTETKSYLSWPRHASWAAEDTPPELSGPKRDSFDAMTGVAYALASIQALQAQIDRLKERL